MSISSKRDHKVFSSCSGSGRRHQIKLCGSERACELLRLRLRTTTVLATDVRSIRAGSSSQRHPGVRWLQSRYWRVGG
jgi:hypothetical protein